MANPFRPLMGRYTLLPSASNWASVSEEAENVTPVVEGTLYFAFFHCIIMPSSRDHFTKLKLISVFLFEISIRLILYDHIHLNTVIAQC